MPLVKKYLVAYIQKWDGRTDVLHTLVQLWTNCRNLEILKVLLTITLFLNEIVDILLNSAQNNCY